MADEKENLKKKLDDLISNRKRLEARSIHYYNKYFLASKLFLTSALSSIFVILIFYIYFNFFATFSMVTHPETKWYEIFYFYLMDSKYIILVYICIIVCSITAFYYILSWVRLQRVDNELRETHAEIDRITPIIKPEEAYFVDLTLVNIKNLKAYYQMVKSQTEKSFYVSLLSGILGFGLIAWGIYRDKDISTYAGIITEFISGVFFYLYNKTVLQLKEYHDSLLDVQNILLAYKLVESVKPTDSSEKNEMVKKMIEGLLPIRVATPKSQQNDCSQSNQDA
jgi:hypothetical protein